MSFAPSRTDVLTHVAAGNSRCWPRSRDGEALEFRSADEEATAELEAEVRAYLAENPGASQNEVEKHVEGKAARIRDAYKRVTVEALF